MNFKLVSKKSGNEAAAHWYTIVHKRAANRGGDYEMALDEVSDLFWIVLP